MILDKYCVQDDTENLDGNEDHSESVMISSDSGEDSGDEDKEVWVVSYEIECMQTLALERNSAYLLSQV